LKAVLKTNRAIDAKTRTASMIKLNLTLLKLNRFRLILSSYFVQTKYIVTIAKISKKNRGYFIHESIIHNIAILKMAAKATTSALSNILWFIGFQRFQFQRLIALQPLDSRNSLLPSDILELYAYMFSSFECSKSAEVIVSDWLWCGLFLLSCRVKVHFNNNQSFGRTIRLGFSVCRGFLAGCGGCHKQYKQQSFLTKKDPNMEIL
jgi:hypothetical protein